MATFWPPDDIGRDTIPVEPAHAATDVGQDDFDPARGIIHSILITVAAIFAAILLAAWWAV